MIEIATSQLPTFHHGVHPDEHKEATEHQPIRRMPFVNRFILPLRQGGRPAESTVQVGDRVVRGQLIAKPGHFLSVALHSPVTGKVTGIGLRRHPDGQMVESIEIEADRYATQQVEASDPVDALGMSRAAFTSHIQAGGIVGMGGAAFPAHVKYAPNDAAAVHTLVLNGCECEPYLTCDHRIMVEQPQKVIRGATLVAHHLGAKKTVIGVERNKADAVAALQAAIPEGAPIEVRPLEVKYPQGAEKMLIEALFSLEVPARIPLEGGGERPGLPLDVGMVVNNVGTMAAITDWCDSGIPLIERVVTVSGPGVERPANLLVPIGTPIREVLKHCGLSPNTRQIINGGPMMGSAVASLDAPVMKGTSGLLVFTESETALPEAHACIRCGRCLDACGNCLNPSRLSRLARAGRLDEAEGWFLMDCMECGACSFACPSGIPIVQLVRAAKAAVRKRGSKK